MSQEKYYQLGTHTREQWHEVHAELHELGIGTVSRCVDCVDEKTHSATRGTYLLTDEEASQLKQDPRIKFIQTDPEYYPEDYHIPEDDLKMDMPVDRYSTPVKNYHFWANSFSIRGDFDTGATSLNRASSQLLRLQQKSNPWVATESSLTVIEEIPAQRYTGKDVDVICADNGTWIGHTEFINSNVTNAINPDNYIGGNPLPGAGYCDVLDVILDGPYYLDPDWFNADAENRLETRWDGTIVPTELAARNWWSGASNRSARFDFGSITISTGYTRDAQHGSNTTFPTTASANHGTQCASLIYGRTHGWAYNANKWHLNLYGSGSNPISTGFDVQKIFHQYKPVNPTYGNKNPTISSNSWGFRASKGGSFYYWREDAPVAYGGTSDEPEFIRYMGVDGDIGRWSSEHSPHSEIIAGEELVNSGVVFIGAAGNSGQQQVSPDHPNFNNFIATTSTANVDDYNYFEFGRSTKGTTNRRGFPGHIGQTENYEYPAIAVGALDDVLNGDGKEQKVNYSNMGNSIDVYAPADGTLAATVGTYGTDVARYDNTYTGSTLTSRDTRFGGTSAACPVACGIISTWLEVNRSWTYSDIRSHIGSNLENQDTNEFYVGTEATDPEGIEWSDRNIIQSSFAKVVYDVPFTLPKLFSKTGAFSISGKLTARFKGQ